MPAYNAVAVVIRRLNYGETDKILTLYSRERGRFSAIAKGARKTVSRLSGATELLTCTNFNLASGKSLDVVAQAEVHESFTALRGDLLRLAHGLYLADLVDHSVEDNEPNSLLFDLLITGLYLIQDTPAVELAARWFELQLLMDLGYQPDLYHCAICHDDVMAADDLSRERLDVPQQFALSARNGGVVCSEHARPGLIDDHSRLSSEALELLRRLADIPVNDYRAVAQLSVSDRSTLDQTNLALRRYLRFRIERDLKSLTFLDSLRHSS